MAGVEADADARRAAEHVDDRREMLEPVAEVRALPGRVLEQEHRASRRAATPGAPRGRRRSAAARPPRVPVVYEPGCMTSPSSPSDSARSSSSPSASIDFRRSAAIGGGEVDQVAVVRDDRADARSACTRRRNSAISSAGSSRARHWPADFVKICSASQPLASARSTARGSPPAIDRWAPSRGTGSIVECSMLRSCAKRPDSRIARLIALRSLRSRCGRILDARGRVGLHRRTSSSWSARSRSCRRRFVRSSRSSGRRSSSTRSIPTRTARWDSTEEPPRHFLDMDAYGPFPFTALPHDYNEAVPKCGSDSSLKNGVLPWRAQEISIGSATRSSRRRRVRARRHQAVLGGRRALHRRRVPAVPRRAELRRPAHRPAGHPLALRDGAVRALPGQAAASRRRPITPVENVREFMFATLTDSFRQVDAILAADRAAAAGRTAYDDEYFAKFFESVQPILETPDLAARSPASASVITSAWIAGREAGAAGDAPPRPPRPIGRSAVRAASARSGRGPRRGSLGSSSHCGSIAAFDRGLDG